MPSQACRRDAAWGAGQAGALAGISSGLVHQLVGGDPGHHGAQLAAHLLDLRFRADAAARGQRRAPAAFSRMKRLAYSPFWMSVRHWRMAARVSSVTIFGPVSYSPNSALFEIE